MSEGVLSPLAPALGAVPGVWLACVSGARCRGDSVAPESDFATGASTCRLRKRLAHVTETVALPQRPCTPCRDHQGGEVYRGGERVWRMGHDHLSRSDRPIAAHAAWVAVFLGIGSASQRRQGRRHRLGTFRMSEACAIGGPWSPSLAYRFPTPTQRISLWLRVKIPTGRGCCA